MAIDTSKFAVQQIFVVDAFNLDTGALIARFEDLKNSTLNNNGTVVYAQGGVGNPKIIGFSHSKNLLWKLSLLLSLAARLVFRLVLV